MSQGSQFCDRVLQDRGRQVGWDMKVSQDVGRGVVGECGLRKPGGVISHDPGWLVPGLDPHLWLSMWPIFVRTAESPSVAENARARKLYPELVASEGFKCFRQQLVALPSPRGVRSRP